MNKPEPKATNVVCTECGLDWEKHLKGPRKKNPTLEDCVRVLKAELAARPKLHPFQFPQSGYNPTQVARAYNGLSGNTIWKVQ